MNATDVAVIVVNYRTPERSARLARRLAEANVGEIAVVDNSSPDHQFIRAACADLPVQVLPNDRNLGFGAACNRGALRTRAPILLFLNSDVMPADDAIDRIASSFEDPNVEIAAPSVLTSTGAPQVDAFGVAPTLQTILRRKNRRIREPQTIDWVSGAAIAVRRSSFDRVCGFDEGFHMYFEDVDLCRRVGSSSVALAPEAVVFHEGGGSRQSDWSRQRQYAVSQSRYLSKVGEPAAAIAVALTGTWALFLLRMISRSAELMARTALAEVRERTTTSRLVRRRGPRLNLGCGDHPVRGWINVDVAVNDDVRPDVVATLHRLPFRPRSLRSVYCGHVLEHLPFDEAIAAMRALQPLLAPAGEVVAVGPDVTRGAALVRSGAISPQQLDILKRGERRWPGDEHQWFCDESGLLELFAEAGFEATVIDVATVSGWPLSSRAAWQCAVKAQPSGVR